MELPLNVAYMQAQMQIGDAINYCLQTLNIPPFLMEELLKNVTAEVTLITQRELDKALAALAEEQKKEATEEVVEEQE